MSVHQIRPGMEDHRPAAMRLRGKIQHGKDCLELLSDFSRDIELLAAISAVIEDRKQQLEKCKEGGMI
jgi:hypothetical protein